ncbi:nitrous oxide-stimulated promoter family protein [Halochromatium salexigens]|uniref:Nitrous oxide-stimulated promoter family protein n=1 Tax=Halochromatium salexigens TaxID=49447 RepID=A0AAJ0XEE7_HALSE|nr:nitrous oxide-stimulated promoter family protein [Halochromatium salexigens]MBK5929744.1 hypothetical protein [Halochromatium salexigens]
MSKPLAPNPAEPAEPGIDSSARSGIVGPSVGSSVGPRIRHEQRTIDAMLAIYCRDHHRLHHRPGTRHCAECEQLRLYAHQRLASCPFQEEKPVCNRCEVHCYSAVKREQVRAVMRYAGPRMPLRHPWLALRHLLDKLRRVPSLARVLARTKTRRRTNTKEHDQP